MISVVTGLLPGRVAPDTLIFAERSARREIVGQTPSALQSGREFVRHMWAASHLSSTASKLRA